MFEEAKNIMISNETYTDENINTIMFPIIYKIGKGLILIEMNC